MKDKRIRTKRQQSPIKNALIHPFNQTNRQTNLDDQGPMKVFDFNEHEISETTPTKITTCSAFSQSTNTTWINVENASTDQVKGLSEHFGIHYLIQEDILTIGQRPKMDEVNQILYVVLNMLYFNELTKTIEQEQISIALGDHFVISFQEEAARDVFNPIRERLHIKNAKIRQMQADYLFYCLIDMIVDSYFLVIEKVGQKIEAIEESLLYKTNKDTFQSINTLRKEIIQLKRNTTPVRDLLSSIMRSDCVFLLDNTKKYFKDIYDHAIQANELVENYRDLTLALHDIYLNNMNLKMNEVMKTMAIVTTVMAPATVIGGIFGMNFEVIPFAHNHWGFYGTIALMLIIPLIMILHFKKRGWFNEQQNETSKKSN